MINVDEILNGVSQERIQWVLDKFKEFKKDCFSNEQGAIVNQIISICQAKIN